MKNANKTARGAGKWHGMNWIRKDARLAIYLRDGMACMWCGEGIENGAQLTLDHVIPHSKGGSNAITNLVTCCHRCNSWRSDRPAADFAEAMAGAINHGIKAADILSAIEEHAAIEIKPFRAEAKAILNNRPTWQAALEAGNKRR